MRDNFTSTWHPTLFQNTRGFSQNLRFLFNKKPPEEMRQSVRLKFPKNP